MATPSVLCERLALRDRTRWTTLRCHAEVDAPTKAAVRKVICNPRLRIARTVALVPPERSVRQTGQRLPPVFR